MITSLSIDVCVHARVACELVFLGALKALLRYKVTGSAQSRNRITWLLPVLPIPIAASHVNYNTIRFGVKNPALAYLDDQTYPEGGRLYYRVH